MKTYFADYIFPVASTPVNQGFITIDDDGSVLDLHGRERQPASEPERIEGVLTPGFVNTHCHLELSHLLGRSQTGKTLIPFLYDVVSMRATDPSEISAAIANQDRLMWEAGIQAVGDICNTNDTLVTKRKSPIAYYSFVEMFDFLNESAAGATFDRYREVYARFDAPKSAVPHAPYSVSDGLYERINALNPAGVTVSVHNQETAAEDEFLAGGEGDFADFIRKFRPDADAFTATGKPAIFHLLERLDPRQRTLFVHNTLTTEDGIAAAHEWGEGGVYWATCPNANLYIENRLPRYDRFVAQDAKVTIGTDSLTSNWQLSVLEELRTISRFQSYLPFTTLLRWATLNGAEALQMDRRLGSLERGKQPGLLALKNLEGNEPDNFRIGNATTVRRLV